MPVVPALSYPGVYIQEIPSVVRTITGVATSITDFVGRALRGPVDDATTILSFADFERQFGGLDAGYPLGYAVRDFFANGGAQAIVVRAYTPFFATDQDRTDALNAATADAQAGADKVAKAATDAAAVAGATAADVANAASGALAGLTGASQAAGQAGAKAATDAAAVAGATAADVANAATAAKADAVKKAAGDAAPINRARISLATEGGGSGPVIEAASPGTWGNQLRAAVDYDTLKKDDGTSDSNLYNLYVKDKASGRIESFLNVATATTYARY